VEWLREHGWVGAERRALSGVNDKGDVAGVPGVVFEVKNRAKIDLAQFLDETLAETANAGADIGVCAIKRRGKGNPDEWYAVTDGRTMAALLKSAGY
jgi:hypothetical protein